MNAVLHDIAAERSILGAILFHGEAIEEIDLRPNELYQVPHEAILQAMLAVHARGQRPDLILVAEELRRAGTMSKLASLGNEVYLSQLASAVSTGAVSGIKQHAKIVRDKAMLRGLRLAADKIHHLAGTDLATDEILSEAQRLLSSATDVAATDEPKHVSVVFHEAVKDLEKRYRERKIVTGVPTGLSELDEMIGGYQPTDLVILAARPSMGKTAMMVSSVIAAATAEIPVLVFTLEMGRKQIANRMLSSDGRVDGTLLRTGLLESIDWIHVTQSVERLRGLPIHIDDGPNTAPIIAAKIRKWRRGFKGLGLVVIDYLQIVNIPSSWESYARERQVALIGKTLKDVAKEQEVAAVALSQLGRAVEQRGDKRPQLGDLRESGSLEQDADAVLGLYRDEYYNKKSEDKGVAEVLVLKQRNGDTGTVRAAFQKQFTKFADLSRRGDY